MDYEDEDNPLVEDIIQEYEALGDELSNEEYRLLPEIRVMKAMRSALLDAGMQRHYTDLFIARASIHIDAEISESQLKRLATAAGKMAANVYHIYNAHTFYDDSIALLGRHFKINIGDSLI